MLVPGINFSEVAKAVHTAVHLSTRCLLDILNTGRSRPGK